MNDIKKYDWYKLIINTYDNLNVNRKNLSTQPHLSINTSTTDGFKSLLKFHNLDYNYIDTIGQSFYQFLMQSHPNIDLSIFYVLNLENTKNKYDLFNLISPLFSKEHISETFNNGENVLFSLLTTSDNINLKKKIDLEDDLGIFSIIDTLKIENFINNNPSLDIHAKNKFTSINLVNSALEHRNYPVALKLIDLGVNPNNLHNHMETNAMINNFNYFYDLPRIDTIVEMAFKEIAKTNDLFSNNSLFEKIISKLSTNSGNTWLHLITTMIYNDEFKGTENFGEKYLSFIKQQPNLNSLFKQHPELFDLQLKFSINNQTTKHKKIKL